MAEDWKQKMIDLVHFELEATTVMTADNFNRPFLDEMAKG